MVAAIHHGYVHRQVGQPFGCVKAGKACTDNHNAGIEG
jgi:hypothetical protein